MGDDSRDHVSMSLLLYGQKAQGPPRRANAVFGVALPLPRTPAVPVLAAPAPADPAPAGASPDGLDARFCSCGE